MPHFTISTHRVPLACLTILLATDSAHGHLGRGRERRAEIPPRHTGLTSTTDTGSVPGTAVLIGRGNTITGWEDVNCGSSSCNLSVSTGPAKTPWSNLPFFNLSYNLAPGEWSASFAPTSDWVQDALDVPDAAAFLVSVYNPSPSGGSFMVSIIDSAYKSFGAWPWVGGGGWTNVSIPLNASGWLPAGNITFPLRSFSIGEQRQGAPNATFSGWIGFADVALLSSSPPQAIPNPLLVQVLQPRPDTAGVLVTAGVDTEAVQVGIQLENRLQMDCDANLTVQMRNFTGPMGESEGWVLCAGGPPPATSRVPGWSVASFTCTVDPSSSPPGYVLVQALIDTSTGSCARVNGTLRAYELGVALVPARPLDPAPVTRNNHSNVFGGQMTATPAAAARIGMMTIRAGPLWRWAQFSECWEENCFDWGLYDDSMFSLSEAGLEVMIDAREIAPPWAAMKNDSSAWSEFPSPEHYPEYQRYTSVVLDRYGSIATAVEVSNEDDGLAYFASGPIPLNYSIQLSLDLINLTAAAMANSTNGSNLLLVGLSSSMFDIKQEGNGGSTWGYYEKAVLNSPGVINTLQAVSVHPYQDGVWVPWLDQPWGNTSFQFPNETMTGMATNSTAGQLLETARLMKEAAADAGMGNDDYHPRLRPSEYGYALAIPTSATSGWVLIHAALVTQGLIHMRSYPLAEYVEKAFYFAAYDGCCEESNTFYGIWRPAQMRIGVNATQEYLQPSNLPVVMPLPAVSAYAMAASLLDVSSGRAPGVFVVDNSVNGKNAPAGGQLPPSCVAFEGGENNGNGSVNALVAVFITGHHYNDRTIANITVPVPVSARKGLGVVMEALRDAGASLVNGLGTPMAMNVSAVAEDGATATLTLTLAPLPQYLVLPQGVVGSVACSSMAW